MIELGTPPLILKQALQLAALHFRYTFLHTNTIAAKLYNLRFKFRCSNAHTQHTIENRIVKAHSTLMISSTYPGPPSMPRSVTLAKPKNKGKSYTTFLKSIVSTELMRQIRLKYPHASLPPSGKVSSPSQDYMLTSSSTICPSVTTYTNSTPTSQCVDTVTLCLSSDFSPKVTNQFPHTCSP